MYVHLLKTDKTSQTSHRHSFMRTEPQRLGLLTVSKTNGLEFVPLLQINHYADIHIE